MPFATELFVCLIHPVPYIFPNKIGLFMFLRVYLLFRVFRDHSELYGERGTILKTLYSARGGPPIDTELCVKNLIDKSPMGFLFVLTTTVLLIFSYATWLVQREGYDASIDVTFFKCFSSTASLLFRGISRVSTYDPAGRMIELLTVIIGVILIACWIALITSAMDMSSEERFALIWLDRFERSQQRRVQSAELIQATWRLHRLYTDRPEEVTIEVQLYFDQLRDKHRKFREATTALQNLSLDLTQDKLFELDRRLDRIDSQVQQLESCQLPLLDTFDHIDERLLALNRDDGNQPAK